MELVCSVNNPGLSRVQFNTLALWPDKLIFDLLEIPPVAARRFVQSLYGQVNQRGTVLGILKPPQCDLVLVVLPDLGVLGFVIQHGQHCLYAILACGVVSQSAKLARLRGIALER